MSRWKNISAELTAHMPFSIMGVVIAMIMMGFLSYVGIVAGTEARMLKASEELFHLFHPFHIFLSALTTTAVFWKHDDHSPIKAAVIGLVGSLAICGLSDIVFPFIGGSLTGQHMHFHVCIIEEPFLIIPFAIFGVIAGFMVNDQFERSTHYAHGMHVFLSSTASLLYLISFGMIDWMHQVSVVFLITIVAVVLPCCLSDIVFPMVCTHRYCRHGENKH